MPRSDYQVYSVVTRTVYLRSGISSKAKLHNMTIHYIRHLYCTTVCYPTSSILFLAPFNLHATAVSCTRQKKDRTHVSTTISTSLSTAPASLSFGSFFPYLAFSTYFAHEFTNNLTPPESFTLSAAS